MQPVFSSSGTRHADPETKGAIDDNTRVRLPTDDEIRSLIASCRSRSPAYPPECGTGRIEYKWKLCSKQAERIVQLTTQMNFRLTEGRGEAVYRIGVHDDGVPEGLTDADLFESLVTVRSMAKELGVSMVISRICRGIAGKEAEVCLRRVSERARDVPTTRVALLGAEYSGKSTIAGVISSGRLDDGRGRARTTMFRHRHELAAGRTSSVAVTYVGFNAEGQVTNHRSTGTGLQTISVASSATGQTNWAEIVRNSVKVVTLIDLAGSHSYQGTTLFGLTSSRPDYGVIVIPAVAEPGPSSNSNDATVLATTDTETDVYIDDAAERIALCMEMGLPYFIVLSKTDLLSPEEQEALYASTDGSTIYSTASAPKDESYSSCSVTTSPPTASEGARVSASATTTPKLGRAEAALTDVEGAFPLPATAYSQQRINGPESPLISSSASMGAPAASERDTHSTPSPIPLETAPSVLERVRTRLNSALVKAAALVSRDRRMKSLAGAPRAPSNTVSSTTNFNHSPLSHIPSPNLQGAVEPLPPQLALSANAYTESISTGSTLPMPNLSITPSILIAQRPLPSGAVLCNPSNITQCVTSMREGSFIPAVPISAVTGQGLDLLSELLFRLPKFRDWSQFVNEPAELHVSAIYNVHGAGVVLTGVLLRGMIKVGSELLLGPFKQPDSSDDESSTKKISKKLVPAVGSEPNVYFRRVKVNSLHMGHTAVSSARAGQAVAIAIGRQVSRKKLRTGLTLIDPSSTPAAVTKFTATVRGIPKLPAKPSRRATLLAAVAEAAEPQQTGGGKTDGPTPATEGEQPPCTPNSPPFEGQSKKAKRRVRYADAGSPGYSRPNTLRVIVHVGTTTQEAEFVLDDHNYALEAPSDKPASEEDSRPTLRDLLRSGKPIRVSATLQHRPECIRPGAVLLFREGKILGTGRVEHTESVEPDVSASNPPGQATAAPPTSGRGQHKGKVPSGDRRPPAGPAQRIVQTPTSRSTAMGQSRPQAALCGTSVSAHSFTTIPATSEESANDETIGEVSDTDHEDAGEAPEDVSIPVRPPVFRSIPSSSESSSSVGIDGDDVDSDGFVSDSDDDMATSSATSISILGSQLYSMTSSDGSSDDDSDFDSSDYDDDSSDDGFNLFGGGSDARDNIPIPGSKPRGGHLARGPVPRDPASAQAYAAITAALLAHGKTPPTRNSRVMARSQSPGATSTSSSASNSSVSNSTSIAASQKTERKQMVEIPDSSTESDSEVPQVTPHFGLSLSVDGGRDLHQGPDHHASGDGKGGDQLKQPAFETSLTGGVRLPDMASIPEAPSPIFMPRDM